MRNNYWGGRSKNRSNKRGITLIHLIIRLLIIVYYAKSPVEWGIINTVLNPTTTSI